MNPEDEPPIDSLAAPDPLAAKSAPRNCPRRLLIPSELHSFYDKGPFRSCTVCGGDLSSGCLYEIQKVYRGKEVIFEMAICQTCGEAICQEFSEESMAAMKGFLLSSFKPSRETCHCHFCGFPRPLSSGYTLVAACRASALIVPAIVLCDRCGEKLQARLSKKTKESQEDFIRNNFPGVPAEMDLNPTFCGMM